MILGTDDYPTRPARRPDKEICDKLLEKTPPTVPGEDTLSESAVAAAGGED